MVRALHNSMAIVASSWFLLMILGADYCTLCALQRHSSSQKHRDLISGAVESNEPSDACLQEPEEGSPYDQVSLGTPPRLISFFIPPSS